MKPALKIPRQLARKHLFHVAHALLLAFALPVAQASIVDGSFELNPLVSAGAVLNNFAAGVGSWGQENSTITAATGGITPHAGVKMLEMDDDGGVTTQAFQAIDVSAFSGTGGTFSLSAWFNIANVSNAFAAVAMNFYSGADANSAQTAPSAAASLTLDSAADTWQQIGLSSVIPVGTQWILAQVYFSNATLGGQRGYVDSVQLDTPEPGSLALATAGLLGLGGHARRRVKLG